MMDTVSRSFGAGRCKLVTGSVSVIEEEASGLQSGLCVLVPVVLDVSRVGMTLAQPLWPPTHSAQDTVSSSSLTDHSLPLPRPLFPPQPTPPSQSSKHPPERRNPIHKQKNRDRNIPPHNLIPLPPRPKHPRPHPIVIRQQMPDIPTRRKDEIILGHMRIACEHRACECVACDDKEEAAEGVGEEGGCGVQRRRTQGGSGRGR